MLIIGHRGSQGTKAENSIASLREAIRVGADIVEFDVRLTKDGIPVLSHDFHIYRTHKKLDIISRNTLQELQKLTGGSASQIVTLEQALKECFGKIFINIEVKRLQPATPIIDVLKKFCKKKSDWDSIIVSSFSPRILKKFRKIHPTLQLGMVLHLNPLDFMLWHRQLNLSAVGFHRLNINSFALQVAKELGLFTYAYTVNRPEAAHKLQQRGINAIVTDYPDLLINEFSKNNR